MTKKELAKEIKKVAYLEGNFILSSGKRSKYYLDKYLFTTKPYLLKNIAIFLSKMIPNGTEKIAGAELGAVPLATALSLKTNIPFVIVKKKHKDYGTKKDIEGEIKKGEKVVLVEDVLTTGTQAINSAKILKEKGAKILKIIAVIDREEEAEENIKCAGYSLRCLFKKKDLKI